MIKANELRIGNWVLLDGKHIADIESVTQNVISTKNPYNKYTDGTSGDYWNCASDYITPVPLTPEILEKCGFEKFQYGDSTALEGYVTNGRIIIKGFLTPDNYFNLLGYKQDHSIIQYLHQLQNLYFALAGEELQVRELVNNDQ